MMYTSHSTTQQHTTPTHLIHCMHISSMGQEYSHDCSLTCTTGPVEGSLTTLWV